jgi:hypothetical protein
VTRIRQPEKKTLKSLACNGRQLGYRRGRAEVSAGSPPKHNNRPDVSVSLRRTVRRSIVIVAAAVLFPAGALMLVLPGPGLLVIGAGLALLAGEFPVVRKHLQRIATIATTMRTRLRGRSERNLR